MLHLKGKSLHFVKKEIKDDDLRDCERLNLQEVVTLLTLFYFPSSNYSTSKNFIEVAQYVKRCA